MSEKKSQKKKDGKHKIKCKNCQFYDQKNDYCTERNIENCDKQSNVNFSKCDSFLIHENLIYF